MHALAVNSYTNSFLLRLTNFDGVDFASIRFTDLSYGLNAYPAASLLALAPSQPDVSLMKLINKYFL